MTRYFATLIRVIVTPAIYRCFLLLKDVNRHSTEQDSHRVYIRKERRDAAFLLNSWAPLVTIGSDFHQSQAFSRSYSSNWPNSLNYHSSMAIGFSPWRPDAVMGTSFLERYPLFMVQSNSQRCFRKSTLPSLKHYSPFDKIPRP